MMEFTQQRQAHRRIVVLHIIIIYGQIPRMRIACDILPIAVTYAASRIFIFLLPLISHISRNASVILL